MKDLYYGEVLWDSGTFQYLSKKIERILLLGFRLRLFLHGGKRADYNRNIRILDSSPYSEPFELTIVMRII
jgi:hypothetical protein